MKETFVRIARWFLGTLFIYAGLLKWNNPWETADQIAAYQMLPVLGINSVAVILPLQEIVMGILLILGYRIRSVLAGVFFLLILFSVGLAQAILRGLNINCGCFGSDPGWFSAPPVALLRNGFLMLMVLGLYVSEAIQPHSGRGNEGGA